MLGLLVMAALWYGPLVATADDEPAAVEDRLVATRIARAYFNNRPLGEVLPWLIGKAGVDLHVNWRALADLGVTKDTRISLDLHDVELRHAMTLALADAAGGFAELDAVILGNTVVVTTARDALRHRVPAMPTDDGARVAWALHERLLRQPMPSLQMEASLETVVQRIAREADVAIRVDRRSLELEGIDAGDPIAVRFAGGSLAELFDQVLTAAAGGFAELEFVATPDGIVIAAAEDALDYTVTVLFDIGWYLHEPSDQHREERAQDIIDLITNTIGRDSWEMNGGVAGSIAELDDVLVVTHRVEEQHRIRRLLAELQAFQAERALSTKRAR